MKTRFIVILTSIFMMPTISFAGIPTIDLWGVPQAYMETVQTIFSKIENSKQVLTLQKTMAKIGSAKASVSDFINKQKDAITKYKEKMDNYIKTAKEYNEKVLAYKAEVEKYAKIATEVNEKGLGGYLNDNAGNLVGDAIDKLGIEGVDASKVEKFTNQAVSGDFKGMAGDVVGNVAESVGLDASKAQGFANSAMEGDFKGMAGDMVGGVAGSVGLDASKAQDLATKAMDATAKEGNNKLVDAPTVSTTRKAGGFSTKEMAASTTATADAKAKADALLEAKADAIVAAQATSAKLNSKSSLKASTTATADAKAKADAQLEAKADAITAAQAISAELDSKSSLKASVAATADKAKAIPTKQIDIKAKVLAPVKELNTTVTPKRTQFKSSFGYGKVQNKYQMAFASLGGDTKTGETAEGVLIVPESISMYCDINYETATQDKKMEDCLREINTVSTSMVTDKISKKQIDDATNDLQNGYVEFLTATYFEALETYNESLTFKQNKLSPVITTSTNDTDASWRVAKEMHIVLGDRINRLQKLWARVLSMKMYEQFVNERFAKAVEK